MHNIYYEINSSPVYYNPSPMAYSPNPFAPGDISVGVVTSLNFGFDMVNVNQSISDIGIVNIDSYSPVIQPTSVFSIESYRETVLLTGGDLDVQIANHNLVNTNLTNIMPREDVLTCRAIARVGVGELQVVMASACAATPHPIAKSAFCAIATALTNKIVSGSTEALIFGGCKLTIKVVKDGVKKLVDISFEWIRDTGSDLKKEITFWLNFINSTEGMFWISNEFSKI
jgi:hypothetical protein